MDNSHILHAYHFDTKGQAEALSTRKDILSNIKGGYRWLHMSAGDGATRDFLENSTNLDPIIIDALLAKETRPRALSKDDGILIILRAINLNTGEPPEDMISIRMWIDKNQIITTRFRDIKAIGDIVRFIEAKKVLPSPSDLLIAITDRLFERMGPFLIDLEDRISLAEELLAFERQNEVAEDAALVRKRTAIFMRYITPQKTVLEKLLKAEFKWLEEEHKEHLVESLDRVMRYVEELHELRDRSQILNDELNNMHGRRLNDITYIFSVAATIFLPLGFLTGIMGINVGGMPGVDSDNAFWLFSGLCVAIVILQVIVFKKLKWF